jgi:hypothetical protein
VGDDDADVVGVVFAVRSSEQVALRSLCPGARLRMQLAAWSHRALSCGLTFEILDGAHSARPSIDCMRVSAACARVKAPCV